PSCCARPSCSACAPARASTSPTPRPARASPSPRGASAPSPAASRAATSSSATAGSSSRAPAGSAWTPSSPTRSNRRPVPHPIDGVTAEGLVKMYGVTRALVGVDARFAPGAVTVVAGPNGSGKSTLLSLLAQTARPTAGKVRYGGLEAGSPRLRREIGVLGHQSMLYPELTGRENLQLTARLYGLESRPELVEVSLARFDDGGFGARDRK